MTTKAPTYPVGIAVAEECLGTFKRLRKEWRGDNEDEAMRQAMEHALEGWEPPALPARGVGVPLKQIGTGLYEQPAPNPAAIREAWEKAYWRMRSYAVHDNDCKLNKPPHFDGPCSCGLTAALEDALALIQMEEQK